MKKSRSIIGFTLVELLVVIAIIGILAALLLPALVRARDSAMMAKCKSNMKNIANAYQIYAADNDGWFPQWWFFHAGLAAYLGIDETNLRERGDDQDYIYDESLEKQGRIDTAEIVKRLYASPYDEGHWRPYSQEEADDAAYLATTVFRCPKDVGRGATTPFVNQIAVFSYCFPHSLGFSMNPWGQGAIPEDYMGWNAGGRHYNTMGRIVDPATAPLLFEQSVREGESFYAVSWWPQYNSELFPAMSHWSRGIRASLGPFSFELYRGQGAPWTGADAQCAYRHGGDKWIANLAFLDGHVEQVMPRDLFAHPGNDSERGWIYGLHIPGGKTPDWYETYGWYTRSH